MKEFDLIIIGSGPGGYVGAIRAAQLGLKTAVVEKAKTLGGTCLNVGCIPSKALLESSEHYEFIKKEAQQHGISVGNIKLQLDKMLKRKEKVVSDLTQGIDFLFKKNKITKLTGWGQLKSDTEVEITSENNKKEIVKSKSIILATGSIPLELPFAKWDHKTIVSSTEALSFTEVPKKLIVIGGGYIGLELGSVWNRLGSEVTVIEAGSSLCPTMDRDLREKLKKLLEKQGIHFKLESKVSHIEKQKNQASVTFTNSNQKTETLSSDKVLVCIGRKPYTEKLGLKQAGLSTNSKGQIIVNKNFQTSKKNIFAIGDVIQGPMLAHKAEEEGVAVAEFIAKGFCHVNYNTVPSVIYTWPEAASVGLTEDQLKEQNIPYLSGTFPFMANGRAKALGYTDGFVKVLAHKESDKVLGVHILGPRAGDLISEAVIVMEFDGNSEDLARSFHAHPTLSEALREAALGVHKQTRQL